MESIRRFLKKETNASFFLFGPKGTGKSSILKYIVSEKDKYDRLLRYLWLEEPTEINEKEIREKMFNAKLLLEGYAQVSTFPPDVKYQDIFLELQKEARESNNGLWKK